MNRSGFATPKLLSRALFLVNLGGVEGEVGLDELESGGGARGDGAVETGVTTGVAGTGADLVDEKDEGVLVAVGADFDDFLCMAGGFSLMPEF